MKISRKTKWQWKKRARKAEEVLTKAFFIFAGLYLIWHFGRWYEYRQWQQKFDRIQAVTLNTYFFVNPEIVDPFMNATSELYVTGKVKTGLCVPTSQESKWLEGIILRKDLDKVE